MKAIRGWVLVLALLLVASTACEGGTSGSVMGSRSSCSSRMAGGSCKGSYRRLSGTYSLDVETARTPSEVLVTVSASVETGPVRVYLRAEDGTETSSEARPGAPVTISGLAGRTADGFRVYFEAIEGQASGVSYTVEYEYP
jgi:hypothetical protein